MEHTRYTSYGAWNGTHLIHIIWSLIGWHQNVPSQNQSKSINFGTHLVASNKVHSENFA
jgi:hypothetical protein